MYPYCCFTCALRRLARFVSAAHVWCVLDGTAAVQGGYMVAEVVQSNIEGLAVGDMVSAYKVSGRVCIRVGCTLCVCCGSVRV